MTDTEAQLNEWIEATFRGHGRAIRRETDEPYPGEPYMSMADAKDLTRRAVVVFAARLTAENTRLRKALEEIADCTTAYWRDEIRALVRAALISGEKK